jgi:hypothetical protein
VGHRLKPSVQDLGQTSVPQHLYQPVQARSLEMQSD